MDSICISLANELDLCELRKLFLNVRKEVFIWLDKDKFDLSDFDKSTQGELIFTAKVNNKLAGFISIWEEDKFVHNLFVYKDYRKIGIGKKLIEKAIELVGLPLNLKCLIENKKALDYYLHNNWNIKQSGLCEDGKYYLLEYK